MPGLAADFEFIYLGVNPSNSKHAFAVYNSDLQGVDAFSTLEVTTTLQIAGPALCAYDEIYNG